MQLLTKKIEKIISIHKPEVFKTVLLPSVDLEYASLEVEEKTAGLSKLMQTRVKDHIISHYSDHIKNFANIERETFDEKFKVDRKRST